MDEEKTKLHGLETRVVVLGVKFENLQQSVKNNHEDTKRDLEGLNTRFDRFEERFDDRDNKRNGHSHDMQRSTDKLDAITLTLPKEFIKTALVVLLMMTMAIAAALLGLPVEKVFKP